MSNRVLQVRMLVAGTVVFAFYAAFALFVHELGFGFAPVLAASVVFVGFQYKLGKWLALRGVDARDLHAEEFPELHATVERLSEEMGVPKPDLKLGRMGVPNAFAVGRRGAGVVVVSDTLLELLDDDELEGVLAHELAHLKNRDVTVMLLGQSVASIVGIAVFWLVALADDSFVATVVGWTVSSVVQTLVMVFVLAISRYREYAADEDAVAYTGDPEALGRALAKIASVGRHEEAPDVDGQVGALCIFGGKRGLLAALFATHPRIEERIERLAPHLLE